MSRRRTLALLLLSAGVAAPALSAQGVGEDSEAPPMLAATERRITQIDVPIHPGVAAAPDGRHVVVMQTRPDPVLWILHADGSDPFAFRKMWAAYRPRWSGGGNRIGFIAAIGPPRIWTVEVDPRDGRPIDPPRLLIRTSANAFAFSPDGERIALVASRSTAAGASQIHIVEWESRRYRVLPPDDGTIYWLDWAPDGGTLYYGLHPTSSEADPAHEIVRLRLNRPAPGARETVLRVAEFLGLSPDGERLLYRPRPGPPPRLLGPVAGGEPLVESDAGREVVERPASKEVVESAAERQLVEIADADGRPIGRLSLPAGYAPRWGSDAGTLLQTRVNESRDAVWRIDICIDCAPGSRR